MSNDHWQELVGYVREELVNRSKDPGVWLDPREEDREIRIRGGSPDSGYHVFTLSEEDLEREPRLLAVEMVEAALEE